MRLYHGSANCDDIRQQGLLPVSPVETDFSDDLRLKSLGGVYMTDRADLAAFYAAKSTSSEMSLGGDPCLFAIEIDEGALIADEDQVVWVFREEIRQTSSLPFDDGLSIKEVDELIEEHINDLSGLARRLKSRFELSDVNDDQTDLDALLTATVRAVLVRDLSFEYDPEGESADDVAAINRFCSLARVAIDPAWNASHTGEVHMTARTMSPVSPQATGTGSRIVGSIRLKMDATGLNIEDIEFDGVFELEDALAFQDDFIWRSQETSFVSIGKAPGIPCSMAI
jgi:hypothetical protein